MSGLVPLPVVVPLLGAALTLLLSGRPRLQRSISVLCLSSVLVVAAVLLVEAYRFGPVVVQVGGWPAPVGIVLVADQLAALMVLVSSAVTLCVLLYSIGQGRGETGETAPVSIYHPTYLVLTAGVTNAFLAGDLFNLFVGFEILLAASFVLITLGGTEVRLRTGSTYVVVSILSSLLFLSAVGLVYAATGTLNMAQLAGRLDALPSGVRLTLQLMLLLAFGIKAAVFPLSAWLPDSYPTAPAPVTAVFAGLLTKVGVYAIIRTETLLFPGGQVAGLLMVVAGLTMVVGILGAVAQSDLKRLLSFTLVSHIGYMIFGVALSSVAGLSGAIFYVVHHITIQTTLFLVAGLVEERAGSTDLRRIGGLARVAPMLGVLFFVPAMNLAGIPPFSGFLGKLGLLQAGVAAGGTLPAVLVGAGTLTSLLTLYAASRVWNIAFWRAPRLASTTVPARLPGLMVGATTALVALGVLFTLAAGPLFQVTSNAATDLRERTPYVRAVLPRDVP
ncbi:MULTISPECIES: Na+/H+ antiporter subunit D [Micromonospora]|uniref:Na+/H+ antiporter subunit D n=1 Tax=Micromonospora TaxID=1873 RepID=UPI0003EECA1D|nr:MULTISPECIES: Na+/H+ antiporter subunit D [Micromonospora]EWM65308.1 Na+/H+ antiporter subunit D [Micromonospora sp. M42]MBP1781582.1 multicomponent Na+:H+ antiporter subunit D [Micromonospora sp. HB375]MBQ1059926.1 Na+/H+ antiporter subunit D [Micromonospora sp. C41]MCK1809278.1 Na+/H+ antiporter subunit D [Micromonospora sp. R42106]MCK1835299.1 Na+/H+ antiporter subunit D [Micromonospora sp. R42003]